MNSTKCTLCGHSSIVYFIKKELKYYRCINCYGIHLDESNYLSPSDEKKRYENHNNDVYDDGYRQFVSPITNSILKKQLTNQIGLDFGSGTNSATSTVLKEKGYNINLYDPFFNNNTSLLEITYDYIICCEVIEHFFHPKREFSLLYNLLNKNGNLYCMTDLFNESMNFRNWYYKEDPTHVFFYQNKTLYWIKENYNFSSISINGRLIIFRK